MTRCVIEICNVKPSYQSFNTPISIIRPFNTYAESNSCQGVYHLGKSLRTKIVAIHHLPNTPETLWLRILGRKTQKNPMI
ncbi:hypothetical protein FIV49_16075 [Cylindrospermopsis raciborskii GIHE 2018]|nr:hypothetical protein FIV49_16075 [Cylindrospermopsis raciborskii GIHE 2018]